LLLHTDFIEYEPISKEIQLAEEGIPIAKKRMDDVIVVLTAVESDDDESTPLDASTEIRQYGDLVKCEQVLIYPYAHLSSNLALPKVALELLQSLETDVRKSFPIVARAPFGWTKSFNIKVKGHPLAENARTITGQLKLSKGHDKSGNDESTALKAEETVRSSWHILELGGHLVPLAEYSFKEDQSNLKTLADYEFSEKRIVDEIPPHVKLMKRLGIADYEPASDSGNMRFYPKGKLMKSLIESHISRRISEYGGMEVETPIMYDSNHPTLQSYFNRFPARQYNVFSDNRQLFLRFAACFGQFLMAKDFQISYKNLPLRLYELTRYSFRREKSGELVGLRRLRAFSMPDCHALCKDLQQTKQEFLERFDLSLRVLNELGISPAEDVEMAIRFTSQFYEENKDFIEQLVSKFGRPVLVEMWPERFFYFTLKWEFNFIDNIGKAAALSTDQIDVENGERYNIQFVDEDNTKKFPIILHNSPSGAVERVIYALLEKAARNSKLGEVPVLPLWLTHTHVRLIPVSSTHIDFCEQLFSELTKNQIRADIDDRDESVGKKIRDSETEWIFYSLVIGDNEVKGGQLVLRDRATKSQYHISLEEIIRMVRSQIVDRPYLPLNLPSHLSRRPKIMN
ncbi:MAG: threonine--tRNA ligase, partial [Thermoproteota archaeon]|nr:threonine--tRNA ligase [Thermoproteota archaeon]